MSLTKPVFTAYKAESRTTGESPCYRETLFVTNKAAEINRFQYIADDSAYFFVESSGMSG